MILLPLILSLTASASPTAVSLPDGHFFSSQISPWQAKRTSDCRAHIREVVCLVDPAEGEPKPRVCLPGSGNYAHYFEALHDHYPSVLQKMFCSLDAIYIEKQFFGTAYGGINPTGSGAILGIRQSVLDENLDLQTWSSWKEQLSFGGIKDSYILDPGLPETIVSPVKGINDFLYFVVAHEFGHILDFANSVNETDCPEDHKGECAMKEGSWGSISWLTDRRPKYKNDFIDRIKLCFYSCDFIIDPERASRLYGELAATDFISAYATTQPWDDFADSLAYFLVDRHLGLSYVVDTKQGAQYNTMEKLHSPRFAEKYRFLETFLSRADIKYP